MDFKSIKDLNKYLQSKVDETLNDEVAVVVKNQIAEGVRDVVYAAGVPKMYIRRGIFSGSSGLGDITKMHHTVNNGILIVTDDADFDRYYSRSNADYSKSLGENIEYGYGTRSTWYDKPRPFIKESRNRLESNNKHIEAMKKGLKRKGMIVE
jgi:hypothetical protein